MQKTVIFGLFAVLLSASAVSAQDHGPIGLTTGYPTSLGLIWHVTDRIALVPEINFSRTETESTFTTTTVFTVGTTPTTLTTTSTASTKGWTVSPAISLQYYLTDSDRVATYLTGGISYLRSSVNNTVVFVSPNLSNLVGVVNTTTRTEIEETTTDGFGVTGGFGVQYTPHRRFGIFGEVGVRYSESENDRRTTASEFSSTGISNSSSVGVIFYF